jgi:uncharacterized protein YndB with AHSA1/START domain
MTTTRHGSATFEFTDRTVRMKRRFQAPVALVFDAMTRPEHVRVWFPADEAPLHICEIDLRVGGKYHYAWYAPGDIECSFRGTFLEIEPPTRIVATWLFDGWPDDEAVETVVLSEHDGITTIADILDFKAPENLGDHFQTNDGAQASWDKLDDLLADLQGAGLAIYGRSGAGQVSDIRDSSRKLPESDYRIRDSRKMDT